MTELTERQRNKRLFELLDKLITQKDVESIELIKTLVENDTPSMKKTFEIMTNGKIGFLMNLLNMPKSNETKEQ